VQGLLEFAKTLGAPRIAAMAAVTLALVGFFAFLILRVTAPQMTPLFTDLSYEDSSAIVKDLERQGVVYDLRNDGGTVMVPKDRVARLRMSLAGEGLPKGGGVGYEIFDKSDALGTTSFIQNINNLRALEGELARTIRGLDRVVAARVHLVLPERPLFSRDKVDPAASIVLKVHGALEPQQVRAIRHLVASAVNGLKPQRVSIVDEAGRLLAGGTGNDEFAESRSTSGAPHSKNGCATRSKRSFPPSSAPAARVSKSAPISISIASPRPRTNSIRKVAWCVRARRGRRHPQPRAATIR
jgi:flagellar M-ring protein FliF